MKVRRASLATSTEVGIVTYGTLVAVSSNIRRLVATERSIAVDAIVSSLAKLSSTGIADWFIDGNEAMSGMDEAGINNACRAIVPVGAVKALVTDTKDGLLALALYSQRNQSFCLPCHNHHKWRGGSCCGLAEEEPWQEDPRSCLQQQGQRHALGCDHAEDSHDMECRDRNHHR